ncbi:MAG TPA: cyclic nucleotide-binding domain-containing protein [Kaistella sp.]|jgi:CRP-like cAMP-binding protein|nr:Crp/Fnr family transcriptional regulator [Flavobacteriales bacterium]HMU07266.1 cyclic nucleotide-binding domain-containing protein [Kaistella sp.]HPZ24684.1 cyclic nucleotide-binding domain-containing protein [Kaistella sp.]
MKKNKKRAYPFLETSNEEWDYFASKFTYAEFPKGSLMLNHGVTENHLTFLEEGLTRSFLPNDGREKTLRFTFPGNFVSSYASFILQKPSEIAIETLSDCKCWRITYDDLQDCYLQIEKGNRMGRISAEYLYITSSSREINMLVKSPEQQYLELLESSPEWFQHIPLKHVASYLGITPQALSRIRARIF